MTRALVLAALAAAGAGVVQGLARMTRDLLPLSLLLGAWAWVWLALLVLSAAVVLCAVVLEVRDARARKPRGLAAVRAVIVCVVLGAATLIFAEHPFERAWFDLAVGLTGGAFGAALLIGRAWPAGPWRTRLDFVLFNLALAVLLCELALRLTAAVAPSPLFSQPDLGSWQFMERLRLEPGRIVRGFPANQGGHYDEEFVPRSDDEVLVSVVGDSFSVGTVHHLLHYTTVSEELCGMRFDNYGVSGIGAREYRALALHAMLPERPDALIVSLFLGNDLALEPMLSVSANRALRAWLDRDNLLAYQVPYRLRRMREAGEATVGEEPRLHTLEEVQAAHPWVLDPSLEVSPRSLASHLEIEVHRAWSICRQLDSYEPLMEILLELEAACTAAGAEFGVMLIPDEFQVEEPLWERVLTQREGADQLERFRAQRELSTRLEAAGIAHLDLLPALRAQPVGPDGWRHLYHLGDTHFNARGNRVAAEQLAPFVEQLLGRD